jgi:hypothetical protein
MKTLVSALALLVGSNIAAIAADQTLKFKLVTFYVGEKDGEQHMVGVSVSADGTMGTKDFYNKPGENGASTGHSTYYFPDGSLVANYSLASAGTKPAAILSANTRSFPEQASIKARRGRAHSRATGAIRARSRTPASTTLS